MFELPKEIRKRMAKAMRQLFCVFVCRFLAVFLQLTKINWYWDSAPLMRMLFWDLNCYDYLKNNFDEKTQAVHEKSVQALV